MRCIWFLFIILAEICVLEARTLKKSEVLGIGVYSSKKLGKLKGKFPKKYPKKLNFEFDEWNSWRQKDGFLCRNNNDCNWIDHRPLFRLDSRMDCGDFKLGWTPSVRPYFSKKKTT